MNSRFIGGVLLIVGTSIGGGMLALPVVNSVIGFWQSSVFLFACWMLMTLGALFILEANLYLPRGSNMMSMAIATLGTPGMFLTWLSYLLLLYSLLAAYIAGGADVFHHLFSLSGIAIPSWFAMILFTGGFGCIAYSGIRQVDMINRSLMFGKLFVFFILLIIISPNVASQNLISGNCSLIFSSVTILLTSFGFAIIVPNLRDYFDDDITKLRQVIWIGSLIPLICYIAWDLVIIGSIPTTGSQGLGALLHEPNTNSGLALAISATIHNRFISQLFNAFSSICMLTAFLGVSLCLLSFLADGLNITQKGGSGLFLYGITFLPPLFLVYCYPGLYLYALSYAGICCIILLLLLPCLMTVYGRKKFNPLYRVAGGAFTQLVVIVSSLFLLLNALWRIFL